MNISRAQIKAWTFNRGAARLALLALPLLLACQGETMLTSPVISVDLRHKLPAHLQRLVVKEDPSYPCKQSFQISAGEATQRFTVIWKVLEQPDSRFITAVQVDPDGPISGAASPVASGMVGELTVRETGGIRNQVAPLRVKLRARSGCGNLEGATSLELSTDFSGCKKPVQPKMKLLTPVD